MANLGRILDYDGVWLVDYIICYRLGTIKAIKEVGTLGSFPFVVLEVGAQISQN